METGNLLQTSGWTLGEWRLDGGLRLTGFLLGAGMTLETEGGRWEVFRQNINRQRRTPVLSVMVENYGSVSAQVKNVTLNRKIQDSLHEPMHGSASVTLEDTDGSLIENGRSVIRKNDKVKIWTGFARNGYRHGDLIPRFTGVVYEPKVNTGRREVMLSLMDYGYLMKQAQTGGDFSDYNTPKLLVNELLNRLNLGDATWENESGLPTTYEIGMTDLSRRNYWKITHGATMGIGYVYFFDGNGDMQCLRRDHSSESGEVFKDTDIIGVHHVRTAGFVNQKSVDLNEAAPVPWSATADDSLRWGQATYTKHDRQSQALYGVSADYESEEMIAGWDNIYTFARDSILWLKYPRDIYELRCAAHPFLDIADKIRIDSAVQNIHGQMSIIGLDEYISAATYSQTLTLLTHRELF